VSLCIFLVQGAFANYSYPKVVRASSSRAGTPHFIPRVPYRSSALFPSGWGSFVAEMNGAPVDGYLPLNADVAPPGEVNWFSARTSLTYQST
jgi:hypothetical protein